MHSHEGWRDCFLLYHIKMKNILTTRLQMPDNVQLFIKKNKLIIKGPLGSLSLTDISFLETNKPLFYRLIQKAIIGVSFGFIKQLVFVGVGYRVESLTQEVLNLKLGYSHLVTIKIPESITVYSPKRTVLILKGFNLQFLNEFVSYIRSQKLPDVYKGKGILEKNEIISLKDGKKK